MKREKQKNEKKAQYSQLKQIFQEYNDTAPQAVTQSTPKTYSRKEVKMMGQSSVSPRLQRNKSFERFEFAQNWAKPEPHLPPTQQKRSNAYQRIGKDIFDLASNISRESKMNTTSNHFAGQFRERNKNFSTYGRNLSR